MCYIFLIYGAFVVVLLQEVLMMCGNRKVLFDNKTRDASKKAKQLRELLGLVNTVVERNCGKPYTDEIFSDLRVCSSSESLFIFF